MGVKVLVVDDSTMMLKMIKNIVSADPDIDILADAVNGEEALEKVKEINPDVVLLDIEMPVMDGIEFMKRLKLISDAKVIILSKLALEGSSYVKQTRELGAVDVIAKPSGVVSLDLENKKGHEIVKAIRKAMKLPEESQ